MVDKIQLTLYEIFGYLFPGAVAAVSIAIMYWAMSIPTVAFPVYKVHPDVLGWTAFFVLAYLLGHILQGFIGKYLGGIEDAVLGQRGSAPAAIIASAKSRVATIVDLKAEDVDANSLFRIADEYSLQKGLPGDRDVYVYREGFYRGCFVAFLLLSLALVVRALRDSTQLRFPAYVFYVSRMQILVGALVAVVAARICKRRFERFGTYRVTRAVFAFLVLSHEAASSAANEQSKTARV